MKSSKYTQVNGPNDNDYGGSQQIIDESNNLADVVHYTCQNTSKDYLLASSTCIRRPEEKNANGQGGFEMVCNCALKDIVYYPRSRLKQHYSSEQDIVFANKFGFAGTDFPQYSLDRKTAKRIQQKKHRIVCERNASTSAKRPQSPEIINIHRANDAFYGAENFVTMRSYDFNEDDYGFRGGQSLRRTTNTNRSVHSRR